VSQDSNDDDGMAIMKARTITKQNIFNLEGEPEDSIRHKFKPHAEKINNLVNTVTRETIHDIVSCIITNDASRIICVL